ncbi:TetR family transcriptional regulator [Pseudonocardia halophobica]|uniref:TetR family transcriptional regulator n=1 Tax=Pseudonocardia halophobica TaxID=29401 RepID=A0A9W6KZC2_9PSEU|nr:TetR family transcriptional regulator [Pseudonocardia halophobica]GLL10937.1 TetR family transcriptional regulator [Pseudonocardia halophobica]
MPPEIADGRLRKGAIRRRALLDATLRLVGRSGVAAVTQRAVAAEAELPPSAVLYYFASVDELLITALREVNDRYVDDLSTVESLEGLADLIADYAAQDRERTIAEYDLYLLAARRPDLRGELERWDRALDELAQRLAPDRAELVAAAVNGLYLRAATSGIDRSTAARILGARNT